MIGFEENEVSQHANGGTELSKRFLANDLADKIDLSQFQIIPSRVRELQMDKIRVLWVHDTAEDPEFKNLKGSLQNYHKIVFVSHWQMQEFVTKHGIPMDDRLAVIANPVEPIELVAKPTDKINLIYFSTPQRGLEIAVPVIAKLAEVHPEIHLDVFSSFQIYGWAEADKGFEPLYDQIRANPHMTYHGFKPYSEVREALKRAHVLAYPSIWRETACRCLIEAMSAGLYCVHPSLAALPDTSGGLTSMYQFNEDVQQHAKDFYLYLSNAVQNVQKPEYQQYNRFVKAYADTRFNAGRISNEWEWLLRGLAEKYPTAESRRPQDKAQGLIYRTV